MRDGGGALVAGRLYRWWSATERLRIACHHESLTRTQFLRVLERLQRSAPAGGLARLLPRRAANQDAYAPRPPVCGDAMPSSRKQEA